MFNNTRIKPHDPLIQGRHNLTYGNIKAVFDRMDEQGVRCINLLGRCMYRNDQGHCCAVGALIDDEYYDPSIEQTGLNYHLTREGVEKTLGIELTLKDIEFLKHLQCIHDKWDSGSFTDYYRTAVEDKSYCTLMSTVVQNILKVTRPVS